MKIVLGWRTVLAVTSALTALYLILVIGLYVGLSGGGGQVYETVARPLLIVKRGLFGGGPAAMSVAAAPARPKQGTLPADPPAFDTDELLRAIGYDAGDDFSRTADKVRKFVNENSINKIDDEYRAYATQTDIVIRKLIGRSKTTAGPPHLECSSRSAAMRRILGVLGVKTRLVACIS